MNIRLLPVAMLTFAAILACGGGEEKKTETPPAPPAPPTEQAKPAEPAAGAGDIGVAECDEYIKKMTECVGKMDASVKATYETTFTQTKDAWKQAAATPEGKAGLQAGCKAALDAMASMPCGAGSSGAATDAAKPADAGAAAAKKEEAKPAEPAKKEEPKKEEAKKEEPKKEEPHANVPPPPPGQGKGRNR